MPHAAAELQEDISDFSQRLAICPPAGRDDNGGGQFAAIGPTGRLPAHQKGDGSAQQESEYVEYTHGGEMTDPSW
jgi:hypothetical protein